MNGGMMKSPMKLVTDKCKLVHVRRNNYTYIKSRLQINCCHQEKKKVCSISAEGRKTIVTLTVIRKQMEEENGNHLHITGCIHDVALL